MRTKCRIIIDVVKRVNEQFPIKKSHCAKGGKHQGV